MNRVVHFEIHGKDLDKMQKFYKSVFGWKITDMGPKMGNYRLIDTGKDAPKETWPGINGGLTPRSGPLPTKTQSVNAFVCTMNVDKIDMYIKKVIKAGGSIAVPKMDVPGVGWLIYCKDPEGNIFGMLQPQKMSASGKKK